MKKEIWFKRKKYGWGWYPVTWQGWTVIASWVIAFVFILNSLDYTTTSGWKVLYDLFLPVIIILAILFYVCYIRGERPRWSWGS